MPINILRLNHAPSSHPNPRIAFIKPLPRPPTLKDEFDHASTFLYAIAAQCLPIMKSHHLSVTTLEEHEFNREFIGRNFNKGEVIQLVLRRRDGSWMSFNQVQMVMMHELAHNLQMNHAKAFWSERNRFVGELKGLWDNGYTGEGFWGSGRSLEGLNNHQENLINIGIGKDVKDLCGGTYRSRRMKRKRAGADGDAESRRLTWKEQRDRRVERRFGKNGMALGEDEDARMGLEICRKGPIGGKPRVAGSKRGRELRAAAALSRFEVQEESKSSGSDRINDDHTGDDSDQAWREDDEQAVDSGEVEMIKVCDGEEADDTNMRREMQDFHTLHSPISSSQHPSTHSTPLQLHPPPEKPALLQAACQNPIPSTSTPSNRATSTSAHPPSEPAPQVNEPTQTLSQPSIRKIKSLSCPICTTSNDSLTPTCITCSHVLDRRKDPRAWKCNSEGCVGSAYLNAGDSGRCGGCGDGRGRGGSTRA